MGDTNVKYTRPTDRPTDRPSRPRPRPIAFDRDAPHTPTDAHHHHVRHRLLQHRRGRRADDRDALQRRQEVRAHFIRRRRAFYTTTTTRNGRRRLGGNGRRLGGNGTDRARSTRGSLRVGVFVTVRDSRKTWNGTPGSTAIRMDGWMTRRRDDADGRRWTPMERTTR